MYHSWKFHEITYMFATFELKLGAVVIVVSVKTAPDSPPLSCPIRILRFSDFSSQRLQDDATWDTEGRFRWLPLVVKQLK